MVTDRKEYMREYRKRNRERINAYQRAYYAEHKEIWQDSESRRRDNIRHRDRECYPLTGACAVCGEICDTQIHHFRYSDVYDERALIEVCPACHLHFHDGDWRNKHES